MTTASFRSTSPVEAREAVRREPVERGSSRAAYRRDIDGLRGVAVLSVLLHHLDASLLPGGFIGVDIFFVVSGFLITSRIHDEALAGTFSILDFYKRRINRIVPALALVVFAAAVAGFFLLLPAELMLFARSAAHAMAGVSNIYFEKVYGAYFAPNASEAPLLHTWSLGVEEQFYVLWPWLVMLLVKVRRPARLRLLAVLVLAAIAVSELSVRASPTASYYLLPSRFFELMVGSVLAMVSNEAAGPSLRFAGAARLAGAALIAASFFALDPTSAFPGLHALPACAGAALLIWSGRRGGAGSGVLASAPMVFLGSISYSLYLWHWPVIAYRNYLGIAASPAAGAFSAALSIGLAWITWKTVEVPMRASGAGLGARRVFVTRLALPLAAALALMLGVRLAAGFPDRFGGRVAALEQMAATHPEQLRAGCHVTIDLYATPASTACRLGVGSDVPHGILIGDSFANHFTRMVDVMARKDGLAVMDYSMNGCLPILGYDLGTNASNDEKCRKRNRLAYDLIARNRFDRVVLAGRWPYDDKAGSLLSSSIRAILDSGAKVTVILANETIADAASCPVRTLMFDWPSGRCDVAFVEPPAYLGRLRREFPQVAFIDPNRVICHAQRCSPMSNGKLLYRDDSHLNDVGSGEIGRQLLQAGVSLAGAPG